MKKLNGRHLAFIELMARTNNATESAAGAGFSARTASVKGSQLMADQDIAEAVRKRRAELCAEIGVDTPFIVLRTLEVLERCTEGTPHLTWDETQRKKVPDGTWTQDNRGALQALKLLGELTGSLRPEKSEDGKTEINILLPPGAGREVME